MDFYQPSFFDHSERLNALTRLNDPLVDLKRLIDFEIFRPILTPALNKAKTSSAGRKAFDPVFMFKILIIQRLYNLSDEQAEFQINDRNSFQRFLGIKPGGKVPDFSTIWRFREALTEAEAVKPLFDAFTKSLEDRGILTKVGSIVDASFVEVPRQRNTRDENELVKDGKVPEAWKNHPSKLAQKDMDARWTKKNDETFFGYKNHVLADAESSMIRDYTVTDASVHDSQPFPALIKNVGAGESLFGDSAYTSAKTDAQLEEQGVQNFIHHKAFRNRPLSKSQNDQNRVKSQVRCLIEHIFGCVENSMGGPELEYIGLRRIATGIGLSNLAYNILNFVRITRMAPVMS